MSRREKEEAHRRMRNRIIRHDPIGILIEIATGKRIAAAQIKGGVKRRWCVPTIEDRIKAATSLAHKVLPDLKSTDIAADPDAQFQFVVKRFTNAQTPTAEGGKAATDHNSVPRDKETQAEARRREDLH